MRILPSFASGPSWIKENGASEQAPVAPAATEGAGMKAGEEMPYVFDGYRSFDDPDGYPAVAPPWRTLNAIDLNSGEYLWKIPLGTYPALAAQGLKNTGSVNYGGPIVP